MRLEKKYSAGHLSLFLHGELDQHSAPAIWREIETSMDRFLPRSCALDLSGMSFMDSSGIALILRIKKRMDETGGKLLLENASPQPQRVLVTSGVGRIVKIKETKGNNAR